MPVYNAKYSEYIRVQNKIKYDISAQTFGSWGDECEITSMPSLKEYAEKDKLKFISFDKIKDVDWHVALSENGTEKRVIIVGSYEYSSINIDETYKDSYFKNIVSSAEKMVSIREGRYIKDVDYIGINPIIDKYERETGVDVLIRTRPSVTLRQYIESGKKADIKQLMKSILNAIAILNKNNLHHGHINIDNIVVETEDDKVFYKLNIPYLRLFTTAERESKLKDDYSLRYSGPVTSDQEESGREKKNSKSSNKVNISKGNKKPAAANKVRTVSKIDSDVYSLALIVYELLNSGRLPFEDDETSRKEAIEMLASGENEIPIIEDEPENIQYIIRKMLSLQDVFRYKEIREILEDLDNDQDELDPASILTKKFKPEPKIIMVTVPPITGNTFDEAKLKLEREKFEVLKREEYSDEFEAGVVISQNPAEGTKVEEGKKITVIVSKGHNISRMTVNVPNLIGKKYSGDLVKNIKLVITDAVFDNTAEKDTIIEQDRPANSSVPKGSEIGVVISKGKEPVKETPIKKPKVNEVKNLVKMPVLAGHVLSEAIATLKNIGINYTVEYTDSDYYERDVIMKQSIPAETMVSGESHIVLYVSNGPVKKSKISPVPIIIMVIAAIATIIAIVNVVKIFNLSIQPPINLTNSSYTDDLNVEYIDDDNSVV